MKFPIPIGHLAFKKETQGRFQQWQRITLQDEIANLAMYCRKQISSYSRVKE